MLWFVSRVNNDIYFLLRKNTRMVVILLEQFNNSDFFKTVYTHKLFLRHFLFWKSTGWLHACLLLYAEDSHQPQTDANHFTLSLGYFVHPQSSELPKFFSIQWGGKFRTQYLNVLPRFVTHTKNEWKRATPFPTNPVNLSLLCRNDTQR